MRWSSGPLLGLLAWLASAVSGGAVGTPSSDDGGDLELESSPWTGRELAAELAGQQVLGLLRARRHHEPGSARLAAGRLQPGASVGNNKSEPQLLHVQATAIFVERAEFPLSKMLFKLTVELALEEARKRLEPSRVRLSVNLRSANTCSRQFAGAIAAEEYYRKRSRLFIVSGCDDAIRAVARLATIWQVPVMTGTGFGADLNDKGVYKTLVRIAFSLRTAVEFLVKILRSFNWRRFNLIVDESDTNSLALRHAIEEHVAEFNASDVYQPTVNVIPLDMESLFAMEPQTTSLNTTTNATQLRAAVAATSGGSADDLWPNEITERAVRVALRQGSLFSRINVLLMPQQLLRKLLLTAHELEMANGQYTFINMPLLLLANTAGDQTEPQTTPSSAARSSSRPQSHQNQLGASSSTRAPSTTPAASFSISTGENNFVWRSLRSNRNSEARQAFESLMSIYLRTPTTRAYLYFAARVSNLANSNYATTTAATTTTTTTQGAQQASAPTSNSNKVQLNVNPYTAAFYDCLQIYSQALIESLALTQRDSNSSPGLLHAQISELLRNRRFDNMVTGSVSINHNGDRDTDYTLDDMNQMTGKFWPVILYRGDTRDIERLSRIQWSSQESVGPSQDTIECHLNNSCPSKPWSKFLVTLLLLAGPLGVVMSSLLYYLYQRINMESQLVDYWWKISMKDIDILTTRRKLAADGSTIVSGAESLVSGSQVENAKRSLLRQQTTDTQADEQSGANRGSRAGGLLRSETGVTTTVITQGTGLSTQPVSSVGDICYGSICLGLYKLAKVALKPIPKLHQSRKLMIELRTIKAIQHSNLCRFVGIVPDEPNTALVSEFCPKGSLREFIQNESMVIDWTFKYSIINDIVAGLNYLHASPIEFHGRLKSSNCLVSSRFVVKLSDYGLGSLYDQMDSVRASTAEQSQLNKQLWLAPEHIRASGSKRCSKKGDVYSLGLLLYEIITDRLPFFDATKNDYSLPIKSLLDKLKARGPCEELGPDMSVIEASAEGIEPLVELMQKCWTFEASKRPTLMVVSGALRRITKGVTSKKLLENLTSRMEQYTNNLESLVDDKLAALVDEKRRTEELLYEFVPKSIALLLKDGQTVEPEAYDCVTVFFSDIVGFTSLSAESTPLEVIDFLSAVYLCFDETLANYDIFKVETIGDAYIVASGLPLRNDNKHVVEIACAALDLRERLRQFKIAHKPERKMEMRVGVHSGPCIAGVVGGLNMPKYCVFGDTLMTGKFMEGAGLPMKIHITEESKRLLDTIGGFSIEPRTPRISKDGLPFQSYWLERN